jgi:methionyl-tRNA formyltransferase
MHRMTRVVFMGSPEFAVPVLRALASHYSMAGVITRPDRPSGRGRELQPPPVKQAAAELGLEIMQPERLTAPGVLARLQELSPDLVVVAAFGQILKPDILALPAHGCLNVHASLLPRWRGAAPIQAAILSGDAETGITIMLMDQGLDTGGILSQGRIPIGADDTAGSLAAKLAHVGADLLLQTLPAYLGADLQAVPQDASRATHAPMLKKQDGLLDLSMPARGLERRVRALNPWPGAFLQWGGATLKIHRAHVETGMAPLGKRLEIGHLPAVGTGTDLLVLDEVQPAGKRIMEGRVFLLGARGWAS